MSFEYTVKYPRALTDAEVARWVTEWNDHGIFSGDILLYLLFIFLAAIPFIFAYWIGTMVVLSSRYRMLIRSGENGMPIIAFAFAWFIGVTIINDIFFAVFFTGPIWAGFYNVFGAESASNIENTVAYFRATAILFGIWD